jgi:DNA replication and repair protein RecF
MFLTQLNIRRVRNLSSVTIEPDPCLNLIYGDNASGKTSLLEAIHVLSLGKSFRTPKILNIIQNQTANLQVVGHVKKSSEKSSDILGIERSIGKSVIRINRVAVQKTSELATYLPVQVITPEAHQLLEQGPSQRRKFLDWGLFHVEHDFLSHWQQYHRILKQRNAAIRRKSPIKEVTVWDSSLTKSGITLSKLRVSYLEQLIPFIQTAVNDLLKLDLNTKYSPGWSSKYEGFEQAIRESINTDLKQGYTHSGPHRSDLIITTKNIAVKDVLSRGQQKLLVCALRLAQIEHLKSHTGHNCVVMIDDLASELDETKRTVLLDHLQRVGAQTFVTVTEPGLVKTDSWETKKLFHVEHGNVNEVL